MNRFKQWLGSAKEIAEFALAMTRQLTITAFIYGWQFFFWIGFFLALYCIPSGILPKVWFGIVVWIVGVGAHAIYMVSQDDTPIDDWFGRRVEWYEDKKP